MPRQLTTQEHAVIASAFAGSMGAVAEAFGAEMPVIVTSAIPAGEAVSLQTSRFSGDRSHAMRQALRLAENLVEAGAQAVALAFCAQESCVALPPECRSRAEIDAFVAALDKQQLATERVVAVQYCTRHGEELLVAKLDGRKLGPFEMKPASGAGLAGGALYRLFERTAAKYAATN